MLSQSHPLDKSVDKIDCLKLDTLSLLIRQLIISVLKVFSWDIGILSHGADKLRG